jgi:streptomycin 3"-adenylyltransferase
VLLTLARGWYTLATDSFASKDEAAEWVLPRLNPDHQAALARARDAYVGAEADDWSGMLLSARQAATELLDRTLVAARDG